MVFPTNYSGIPNTSEKNERCKKKILNGNIITSKYFHFELEKCLIKLKLTKQIFSTSH